MSKKPATQKPALQRLFDLQDFLHQFHAIERVVYLPGTKGKAETDTEHTFTLAMTAWFLAQYFPELNTNACIRQALVHDLVEVYAGDTYVFGDQTSLDTKHEREQAALERIKKEWPDFPEMTKTMADYENRESAESCFVYALDKIMPPLIIFMDQGYTWQKNQITFAMHHDAKINKVSKSPQVMHYYNQLLELFKDNLHLFHQNGGKNKL